MGEARLSAEVRIFDSYVSGGAGAFFPSHFANPSDRRRAVDAVARPLVRDVADALDAQNARLGPSPARAAHLSALRSGAAAVVTGQQVGLFLGPLFTIYKAASAIRLARALSVEAGRPVVPVFWLQTEDHDLPEIATCHVPGNGAPVVLRVPASAAERVSIADRTLPGDVTASLAALGREIAHLPYAAAHLERLAAHYRPGRRWSDAFAGMLGELFASEGLVVLDPRDPALGAAGAPVHRRALGAAESIAAGLLERGRLLEAAGHPPAVHVRPGAPLSFFHPDGAAGPRYRLAPASGGFTLVGRAGHYSREALLTALDSAPLQFSTSALLRPILQDVLLPTAAYVGGPGEVAYFAQLAPLYDAYELVMPLVVPRARLRVIDRATAGMLRRLNLAPDDASRSGADLLVAASTAEVAAAAALGGRVLAPFEQALGEVRREVEALGPGIGAAFEKTHRTVASAVRKLAGKIERARLHADDGAVAALRRVEQMLRPHGEPQERVYGLAYFAARYGERPFLERVLAAADPFDVERPRDLVWTDEPVAQ